MAFFGGGFYGGPPSAGGGGGGDSSSIELPGICGFRLTLESGVPMSTSNQTAKTTLYFTPDPLSPFCGLISNYESSAWVVRKFGEVSLSLSGYTAAKPYDIFAYVSGETLTLESVVWTNGTTRATALATQDSRRVKNAAADRLYVGTIYTSAAGQCEFSLSGAAPKLYVSNAFNRRRAVVKVVDASSSWSYDVDAWRQAHGSADNQFSYVACDADCLIDVNVTATMETPGAGIFAAVGIGIDSTTVNSAAVNTREGLGVWQINGSPQAAYSGRRAAGVHTVAWLEKWISGGNVATFFGNGGGSDFQSGMLASVEC